MAPESAVIIPGSQGFIFGCWAMIVASMLPSCQPRARTAGMAVRGTFLIDPEGLIKVCEIHDNGIGRDASELLRKVKAALYVASHPGEVCPAKWKEGAETLKPSLDLVGKI